MMTKDQIDASIAALQPAPAHETMRQVAVRAAAWLLSIIADEHPEIAVTHSLYTRVVNDGGLSVAPTDEEWQSNIDALDRDLARALALPYARALALALACASDRYLALALDRACASDLALACASDLDRDLDRAIIKLMGDRLHPMPHLDRVILAAVEAPKCSLYMDSWHGGEDGENCDTTHCRAGWAITVHPLGRELEAVFGSAMAGRLIYQVSTGRVPNFFADDKTAMADIRACAAA